MSKQKKLSETTIIQELTCLKRIDPGKTIKGERRKLIPKAPTPAKKGSFQIFSLWTTRYPGKKPTKRMAATNRRGGIKSPRLVEINKHK
jgi:hypothetical protein